MTRSPKERFLDFLDKVVEAAAATGTPSELVFHPDQGFGIKFRQNVQSKPVRSWTLWIGFQVVEVRINFLGHNLLPMLKPAEGWAALYPNWDSDFFYSDWNTEIPRQVEISSFEVITKLRELCDKYHMELHADLVPA